MICDLRSSGGRALQATLHITFVVKYNWCTVRYVHTIPYDYDTCISSIYNTTTPLDTTTYSSRAAWPATVRGTKIMPPPDEITAVAPLPSSLERRLAALLLGGARGDDDDPGELGAGPSWGKSTRPGGTSDAPSGCRTRCPQMTQSGADEMGRPWPAGRALSRAQRLDGGF